MAASIFTTVVPIYQLHSISREVEFMRWFPAAFLTNGVLKMTHGGIELTTPVLLVRLLNHYTKAPLCINGEGKKWVKMLIWKFPNKNCFVFLCRF